MFERGQNTTPEWAVGEDIVHEAKPFSDPNMLTAMPEMRHTCLVYRDKRVNRTFMMQARSHLVLWAGKEQARESKMVDQRQCVVGLALFFR